MVNFKKFKKKNTRNTVKVITEISPNLIETNSEVYWDIPTVF